MTSAEQNTKARIYLANKRGITTANGYTGFHIFNFKDYSAPGRESFQGIKGFNDEVLQSQATVNHISGEDSMVLLLPVIGGVTLRTGEEEFRFLEADTCQLLFLPKSTMLEIKNSYQQESINYITVWFSVDLAQNYFEQFSLFNLKNRENKITAIFTIARTTGFLGMFSGRTNQTLSLGDNTSGALVFVVEGAFEVENRLLENRDSLALWNTRSIEFEALSDNAILLIVEMSQ